MYGTLISTQTVGATAVATIDLTSIPQTFTDLILVTSLRTSGGGNGIFARCQLKINSTTTGYTSRILYGDGTSALSASDTTASGFTFFYGTASSATADTFANSVITLPNYTGSTAKSASLDSVSENNATLAIAGIAASICTSTSAITSLSISQVDGANFVEYSTVSLYGLTKGSGGATVS